MRSLDNIALLAGPSILLAYLAGSLVSRWRSDPDGVPGLADHVAEAVTALLATTAAWHLIQAVSPGGSQRFSRVALAANQVLTAWQSVALWAGLAVVVGVCASAFRRFEGSDGIAATAALLAVHFPWFFVSCAIVGAIGLGVGRSVRAGQVSAIATLLPTAWLGWIMEWLPAWGMSVGPEPTIWAMVVTGVLATRWWHDRPMDSII